MKKCINTVITLIALCFFCISGTANCQATDISAETSASPSVDSVVGVVIAVTVAIAIVFIVFVAMPKK